MCRSIKQLRKSEGALTQAEVQAAALQFVRKVSGYRKPSKANAAAFDLAVNDVTAVTIKLLESLGVTWTVSDHPALPGKGDVTFGDVAARL